MKNKILYILPSAEIGGTEKMVICLGSGIRAFNFQPIVLTLQHRGLFHEILETHSIKNYHLDLKKKPLSGLIRCIFILFKEKPQLMHSFLFTGNIFARCLKIFFCVPLVCSQRSTDNWRKKIHWLIERYTCFLCSLIISNSSAGKKVLMEKAAISSKKIIVIPNGIDVKAVRQKIESSKITSHSGIIVGSIGNLRKAKGYDILIEAANIVCKKRNDIKFVILGKGSLKSYLQKKIRQLKLSDAVKLYGFVNDVYKYISGFDIVIIPSLWEGFPVVALEAMACGKPIIATTAGDLPLIIQDGVNGLLVRPKDAHAMADAIIKLADKPELMKEMGKRSEDLVERFSLKNMIEEYRRVYERLLGENATSIPKKTS